MSFRFASLFLFVILFSCNHSKREFPLYIMNGSLSEQVQIGGILAENLLGKDSLETFFQELFIDAEIDSSSLIDLNIEEINEANLNEYLVKLIALAKLYTNTGNEELLSKSEMAWTKIQEDHLLYGTRLITQNEDVLSVFQDWIYFNSLLLRITANSKYGDEFEKTVYNQVLANQMNVSSETISKLISPIIYTRYLDQVYINVFGNSSIQYEHTTGGMVRIIQDTRYPYDGFVKLKFETDDKRYVDLHIRIPAWAERASVTVGGVKYKAVPGQYAQVTKKWKTGDEVEIILPMRPSIEQVSTKGKTFFDFEYGALTLTPSNCDSLQIAKNMIFKGNDPYPHLKFVSPPGEVPIFTFDGIEDTTLVFQPFFILNNDMDESCQAAPVLWEN